LWSSIRALIDLSEGGRAEDEQAARPRRARPPCALLRQGGYSRDPYAESDLRAAKGRDRTISKYRQTAGCARSAELMENHTALALLRMERASRSACRRSISTRDAAGSDQRQDGGGGGGASSSAAPALASAVYGPDQSAREITLSAEVVRRSGPAPHARRRPPRAGFRCAKCIRTNTPHLPPTRRGKGHRISGGGPDQIARHLRAGNKFGFGFVEIALSHR